MFTEGEFYYRDGVLFCEDVSLPDIASQYGTPCYVYSRRALLQRFDAYSQALAGIPSQIFFAVKANSNLAILSTLARGGAGFDIVSGGELFRVLAAGADASTVVFSGVGKTPGEIRYALDAGIHSFNCESEEEIRTISNIAVSLGVRASVALRVNPDVDANTHPYISTGLREHKFGVSILAAEEIYGRVSQLPGVKPEGVSCHIGSQLLDLRPILEAADKVIALVQRLRARGLQIRYLDLGGGAGVSYRASEETLSIETLVAHVREKIRGLDVKLMLEPGRSIVAEAGVLISRVLLTKQNGTKTFVVVDAAMNDLIRPALYQAHHDIVPVVQHAGRPSLEVDIVGPVCETGDFFARGRSLPHVEPGDLVAIQTAGAYGFVLSSNYNSRPRSCELLVQGPEIHVARERETLADLIRGEHTI